MLLELLAYWGGSITADQFARILGGIRRETAQAKIDAFRKMFSNTLFYDSSKKRTIYRGDAESLRFCPSDADLLLAWLIGERIAQVSTGESMDSTVIERRQGTPLAVEVVDVSSLVPHPILPEVLRAMMRAISDRCVLRLAYASKTRSTEVLFSPHSIVWTSGRHHARGYAIFPEERSYTDVVLGRIKGASIIENGEYMAGDQDLDWNRHTTLTFGFAEDLQESRRIALRLDHGLPDGVNRLTLSGVPAALQRYVIREMLGRRIEGRSGPVWSALPRPRTSDH